MPGTKNPATDPATPPDDAARPLVIAIVGLGWTGVALGQALQRVKTRYQVHGHDRDPARVRAALGAGAIDRGRWSVADLAAGADMVFLTEPLAESLETLSVIAPHARPGTLITGAGAAMAPVMARAAEVLPPGVSYIGGHPIPRAAGGGRAQTASGAETERPADAALPLPGTAFRGATYCLAPSPSAGDDVVRVLHNLVTSIGAEAYFIDAAEHDALLAGAGTLPALIAAALLRVIDRSPSSPDLQRLAGRALMALIGSLASDAEGDGRPVVVGEDAASTARWLGQVIGELQAVHAALLAGDGGPSDALLAEAAAVRARWHAPEVPDAAVDALEEAKATFSLGGMLFGRWRRGRR